MVSVSFQMGYQSGYRCYQSVYKWIPVNLQVGTSLQVGYQSVYRLGTSQFTGWVPVSLQVGYLSVYRLGTSQVIGGTSQSTSGYHSDCRMVTSHFIGDTISVSLQVGYQSVFMWVPVSLQVGYQSGYRRYQSVY